MPKIGYNSSQDAGSGAYSTGNWPAAAKFFLMAASEAEKIGDTTEQARAIRDASGAYVHMGDFGLAHEYADESIRVLSVPGVANREIGATYDAKARVYLSEVTTFELADIPDNADKVRDLGAMAMLYAQDALGAIRADEMDSRPDQYRLNASRRAAAAEGLYGSRKEALKLGFFALRLSLVSENINWLSNANQDLNFVERKKRQFRQFGSTAILFTAGTASVLGSRKTALKLVRASKV